MSTDQDAPSPAPGLQRRDDIQFQAEAEAVVREAEDHRLRFMTRHRNRRFIWMTLSILSIIGGTAAFGWYLLMEGRLDMAVLAVVASLGLPLLLHFWSEAPLAAYARDYKKNFMPKMAKALGGLKYAPERGIGAKLLARTGVVPAHDIYRAEDCLMGTHKGIKVIMSEARLYSRKRPHDPVFQGLFAIMELPADTWTGHTILTADKQMAQAQGPTRWSKLKSLSVAPEDPKHNIFHVFSDSPDAGSLVTPRLLKELAEAAEIFGDAALTAVLFAKKFIFVMIPCKEDMFEASDIHIPVVMRGHALKCKREIDKLTEIIDVLEIYKPAA